MFAVTTGSGGMSLGMVTGLVANTANAKLYLDARL